ncbi:MULTISPECIES: response regulator [unclassified Acidovorax]|uniref:hybrid sensor histidine kinase/response regulator n=1 Tax=unclassified Acidovorax TaxID=2684926 RepID=UPI0028833221|nr:MULTISPECIES: response regulator [unclassified Acidovorax]
MPLSGIIAPTIDRSRHTVLIVDDNPATRYSTTRVVRAAGFLTEEADSGGTAIAKASGGVAAVVLDVHLPDMSGFDVCRALRGNARTSLIPIVHLSAAYVQSEHRVAGLNAGADAYMVHPVEPPLLIATLQALIRARMAEDRLRSSQTRFSAIYDHAPVAMMLIDERGQFTDVNPAAAALFQRSRNALIGTAIAELASPAWQEFVRERTTAPTASAWHGELPLLRADGQELLLDWSMSDHVEPGVRIGIAKDLSERIEFERRREEVLEREQAARVLAERHSRTKDDFVAVLSHELRTPLTLITGWAHMLKRPGVSADMLARGISAIERGVQAQSRIISDILDVSRLASGKLRLHREWADPVELALISLDAVRETADAKKVSIVLERHNAGTPAWLDVTRFQQIIWNLVTNSIKFSEAGSTVRIALAREGDDLSVIVQDEGMGIAPEFLPHLFGRFTQSGPPNNRTHGGLGLGLSIVKHLVELHGGSIQATSAGLGHGTTMTAHLHVAPDEQLLTAGTDPAAVPESTAGPRLQGKDILVVEDNADTSEMLGIVLTDQGARVRAVDNYDAALQEIDRQWPDLLVSDIGLPGKDGYQLIAAIRERESAAGRAPRLRSVALTAFARPQDRARALAAGFDAHLGKPLQPHLLLQLLA